jgi:gluconolactonase
MIDLEIIAEGLLFPEGPVALDDGTLLVVEIARGTLTRIAGDQATVMAELGGGPNGAALGPDGAIYICNNGGRFDFIDRDGMLFPGPRPEAHAGGSIQRIDVAAGCCETLYETCDGRRLLAPNDLVFDRYGGFWFTDHGSGHGDGGLFYAKADGSRIFRFLDEQRSPNGIGLSPDGAILYFADTQLRQLKAYALAGPGELRGPWTGTDGLLVQLPEGHLVDSLAVEAGGTVCVGTIYAGGISACRPDGSFEHIPSPDPMTTNICFGGPGMRDAYLTLSATGRIARTRWPRPGHRLNYQR